MRRAPSPRDLAADLLVREEVDRDWVRDLLPSRRARLTDPRDRALLTEIAYGVLRRRATLDALLAARTRRPLRQLSAEVRAVLRAALYQLLFLDRVPAHAAVNHAVAWARRTAGAKAAGFANAVLRSVLRGVQGPARGAEDHRRDVPREDGSAVRLREPLFPDPRTGLVPNLTPRYACPGWLVKRWLAAFGEARTRAVLRAGITRPPLTLRARGDVQALRARLLARGLRVRPGTCPTALLVEGSGEAAALEDVAAGDAWVQDATAQRVAPLLRPRPGDRLLDLCAAPGGKTLHLADLLGDAGEIVAADVETEKVRDLGRLRPHLPAGVGLETVLVEREGGLPFGREAFDGILVDAPCTNTGVLRRRVEARWRLRPGDVAAMAARQAALLERAYPCLRPKAALVYATCSLEREENEGVVEAFLDAHPDLRLEETLQVPPGRDADGGYAVRLRRAGDR